MKLFVFSFATPMYKSHTKVLLVFHCKTHEESQSYTTGTSYDIA